MSYMPWADFPIPLIAAFNPGLSPPDVKTPTNLAMILKFKRKIKIIK
jgi:hypothetical protein